MRTLLLPFGRTGWEERIRILEQIISSRTGPPLIYNDVLILVPSARVKRFYGRLFLGAVERSHGSAALVPPDVQTLHQFLQKQFERLDGLHLIDETGRLVLLEGLVKEQIAGRRFFNQDPDLLAPSVSSVMAKTIEQLSTAGVSADGLADHIRNEEFSGKPQVRLLTEVYRRYEQELLGRGLTDPAGMRFSVLDRFDAAWLSGYARVIVDGISAAETAEARILKRISECRDTLFLVSAPSRDLLIRAGNLHPLRIVRDFLETLGFSEIEEIASQQHDQYLASALFSDSSFRDSAERAPNPAEFKKRIHVLSALNTREEVSLIAREVKKSLLRGTAPDSVLVSFPSVDHYASLVEEIFSDYGIPFNRALGRPLGSSAVTTALISLLRACQEDYSAPSLLRVFSSPFLKFAEIPSIGPALDRLMRDERIAGGRQKLLAVLGHRRTADAAGDALKSGIDDLFTALEPFSRREAAPLAGWMDRAAALLAWSGIDRRVDLIKGPLNVNLQAYKRLLDTLASLSRAGRTFPGYRYTFHEWLFLLKKTLLHVRFQVPPDDEGGVQVLGLEESPAHAWNEIYLGGMVEGKFPQHLPQNIFLPEQKLEAMGVRTLERARLNASYHFYRVLLSADRVMLTYPENEGDRQTVPSPFLEELAPLRHSGLINRGVEKTSGVQFTLKAEDSFSIPELAKAAGREQLAPEVLTELAKRVPDHASGLLAIRETSEAGSEERVSVRPIPVSLREFSVTELDRYLNCPYDYFISRILGIGPLEEVTEDLTAMDRGSRVHAILRNFYLSWREPVTTGNAKEARTLLRSLSASAFAQEADTFRNRRMKELFDSFMTDRFIAAEIAFWRQGMRPSHLEQTIERFPIVLSNGEQVAVTGKIDRIDADAEGNFLIVDYKTGKYPLPKTTIEQTIFQLPVYAVMAQWAVAGNETPLKKPIGLVYYDLAGKFGAGARDVVLFDRDARGDHPSSKPRASAKSAEEFGLILQQSIDKARSAIERILAGDFSGRAPDDGRCRYCPNELLCEEKRTSL